MLNLLNFICSFYILIVIMQKEKVFRFKNLLHLFSWPIISFKQPFWIKIIAILVKIHLYIFEMWLYDIVYSDHHIVSIYLMNPKLRKWQNIGCRHLIDISIYITIVLEENLNMNFRQYVLEMRVKINN
jgi:hypothetical protein